MSPNPQVENPIVRRREVIITENDEALGFCEAMNRPGLPEQMKRWVIGLLHIWQLIELPVNYDDVEYSRLLAKASDKLTNKTVVLYELPGYSDSYEAAYSQEEQQQNPHFREIAEKLGERVTFKLFFLTSDFVALVVRENGQRQALRVTQLERVPDQFKADLEKVREIFPPFSVIPLSNGTSAVLVDWVEGRFPTTDEEWERCLKVAEPLKNLKIQRGTGSWIENLDLNNSNFIITSDGHIYVIDRHIILGFLNEGFVQISS